MLGISFKKNIKSKSNNGEIVLVIDIRSSSIGAGIIKNFTGKGKAPLILETYRRNINFKEVVRPRDFINKSEINLRKVLEKIKDSDNSFGKIDKVRVFYGSPWYKGFIKNIKTQEKSATIFDSKYLKKLMLDHKDTAELLNTETLERKMISIKINGYKTNKPIGKNVKTMDLSLYQSIVHTETQEEIKEIIREITKVRDIKFNTHPYSVFKVLNEKFEDKSNYTIFDISGEITDMIVIRDGNFERLISIPHGAHYFVRELAKQNDEDFETALTRINLLSDQKKSDELGDKYYQAFIDVKRDWLEIIKKLMNDNQIQSIPADVFLLVDKNFNELALELLNDVEAYSSAFKFGRKPNISHIDSDSIIDLAVYKKSVKKDPFISMGAGFLESTE